MTDEPMTVCGIPLVGEDGIPITDLDGSVPVAAIAVVEMIAADGSPFLWLGHTDGVTAWAGLGMMRAGVLAQEDELMGSWQEDR